LFNPDILHWDNRKDIIDFLLPLWYD